MSLRLLFYILAGLSGIAVLVCTAMPSLSSHNRIVSIVVFSFVGLAFGVGSRLLELAPIEIPVLDYSIELLPSSYTEGYDFDGVKWQEDFEEYRLNFANRSKNTDIHDLRITVDMLGGIVQQKILSQEGCEYLDVSTSDMIGGGIGKGDKIITPVKAYSNNLRITATKVFREGYFAVRLIVKTFSLRYDSEGVFEIRYRYAGAGGDMIKKSSAYKILVEDKDKKTLYIDIENLLKGNYMRSAATIFDKPLTLKGGAISVKGQTIDEPEKTGESIECSLGDLKFAEEEFKKFKEFIGKDIIDSAKQTQSISEEAFAPLPPIKLRTEHPDKEYSCFDHLVFKVRQVKDGFIYLDNKDQDRTIVIEFIFNPETKDGKFSSDFVKINRDSKNYNIDHEISFYEFQKSLIGNAKLVFIDLNNNSIISQTYNFVPMNINPRGSLKNMDGAITLLSKIKRIEAKFNLKLKIPEKFSLQNIKDIETIIAALDGRELKFGGPVFEFTAHYDEAVNMAKNPPAEEGAKILFNNSGFELFNKNIELGKLQITLPPCKVFPTLKQLESIKDKDKPVEVMLKAIEPGSYFTGYYLDFADKKQAE